MAHYTSIQELKIQHPNETEAMQCVFVSEIGEIHEYIIHLGAWHFEIKNLMTSYVFVNGWKSIVHSIKIV